MTGWSAATGKLAVFALLPLALAWGAGAWAAEPLPPPPNMQRGGVFIEPPSIVDPIYLPARPNAPAASPADAEPESSGLSLRLAVDYPLRSGPATVIGRGAQGSPAISPTLQAGLRYLPFKDDYWFGQLTFYRYLHADRQQPWNPDFTYVVGYDDWHPDTFSFTYSNYSGNRFSPDRTKGEGRSNFSRGQWSAGYKFRLPQALEPLFLVGDDDQVGCSTNANLTPRYTDLASLSTRHYKRSLSLGCRYSRPDNWFANVTLFWYPDRSQQQPWDPDFTYGFGYFNWRPGTLSVQYNNYSGNRFRGNERARGQGSFRNGSISLSWTTQF